MELKNFNLTAENLGEIHINDGEYIVEIKAPYSQFVEGLVSQAIEKMYIGVCVDVHDNSLFDTMLYVDMGGEDNIKATNWTPSEADANVILKAIETVYVFG